MARPTTLSKTRSPGGVRAACLLLTALFLLDSPAPAAERASKNLLYATAGRHKLLLDIYFPATPPPDGGYPVIISIHGGGWILGNRRKDLFLRKLTDEGYALASIDYRLSTEAKFPAQIDDSRQALKWLIAHAASLDLNAKRIGVTGASAGAQLALLLGLDPRSSPNPIRAICALYPPTDLIAIIPSKNRDRRDNLVAELMGGPVSDHIALAKQASPINYVSKHAPPVLLIHGDKDRLVPLDQSQALNQALRKSGADSSLIIFQGQGHGFGLRDETIRAVARFFRQNLRE